MADPIRHSLLADGSGRVRHGFFGREGGVSGGLYRSLNCGYGSSDDVGAVRENRALATEAACGLPPSSLCSAYQVHSAKALVVTEPWERPAPRIDAMATARPGIALAILTADCAPVLLADAEGGVIGAAHAGWRGALGGVLEAVVKTMTGLGARPPRIRAVIGPCIGAASYEVGPAFPAPFLARAPRDEDLFQPRGEDGRFLFDLAGYVVRRLEACGVRDVGQVGGDTCTEDARFFSYRRSLQRGEPDYGRNIAIMALGA